MNTRDSDFKAELRKLDHYVSDEYFVNDFQRILNLTLSEKRAIWFALFCATGGRSQGSKRCMTGTKSFSRIRSDEPNFSVPNLLCRAINDVGTVLPRLAFHPRSGSVVLKYFI